MTQPSALSRQPVNFNTITEPSFRFLLKRAPNVVFRVKTVTLPGISIDMASYETELLRIPIPGDHIDFEPVTITFDVDEKLANYLEIWNWMIGLGFPKTYSQYENLNRKTNTLSGEGPHSDMTLTILTNKKNSAFDVEFHDAWPTSLSSLQFDLTTEAIESVEATVTFMFQKYEIKAL